MRLYQIKIDPTFLFFLVIFIGLLGVKYFYLTPLRSPSYTPTVQADKVSNQTESLLIQGDFSFQKKDYTQALDYYQQAINAAPQSALAYYKKGFAYKELNQKEQALVSWLKAAELYKDRGETESYSYIIGLIKNNVKDFYRGYASEID